MGALGGQGALAPPPLECKNVLISVGARGGGQGTLAPTPPLEYENVLISVADPGFWARGSQGT